MANTFDPGLGTSWRYGCATVATMPKAGSTGTGLFWRSGRALTLFAAVTVVMVTVGPSASLATTTASGAAAGLSTTMTPPATLGGSAPSLLGVALDAVPQPTANGARSAALVGLVFGLPNRFDPGLGTSWRYGQPFGGAKPKTANSGTARYWRSGVPLSLYTSALLVVSAVPSSALVTTPTTSAAAGLSLITAPLPLVTSTVPTLIILALAAVAQGSAAEGQTAALVALAFGLPNRFDAGLGTSWRYGRPSLGAKPTWGNSGTARYWRTRVPLALYTSALRVVNVTAASALVATIPSAAQGIIAITVLIPAASGWTALMAPALLTTVLVLPIPAEGQATALVLLVVGFTILLLPTRVDLVTNGRTTAAIEGD